MPEDRRLAAIMFTDIVGYTALMGRDEDKAFQILRKNREIQQPIIQKYNGEWLKEMGDGILASFHTSSDAVRCAGEIQAASAKAGIGLRIGIHEGEVVFEGSDVLGDGVNVASRLEELAEEGCINISGAVYKDIRNKAGISAEFIEEKTLKNVEEPVKVYKVYCEETEDIKEKVESPPHEPRKPSIAVLPFVNMSADPDQEYFCDGMAEEIINALTHVESLKVIARTSTFTFKGKDLKVNEIAKELNVENILEGSVRKAGNKIRITAQLIKADDSSHLWSEKYDRDMKDIFDIQDEISLSIVEALKVKLLKVEKRTLVKRYTENLEAYNLYLTGKYYSEMWTAEGFEKAIECFEQALQKDPTYALAHTGIAYVWFFRAYFGNPPKEVIPKAKTYLKNALDIDEKLAEAHALLGRISTMYDWNWEMAEQEFKQALELNPNSSIIHVHYCNFLSIIGQHKEAVIEVKRARELDPLNINTNAEVGERLYFAGRFDEAIEELQKVIEMDKNWYFSHLMLHLAYLAKKMFKESIVEAEKGVEFSGGMPFAIVNLAIVYYGTGRKADTEKLFKKIEEMAKEGYIPASFFFIFHKIQGNKELAFKWLEKACEDRDIYLPFYLIFVEDYLLIPYDQKSTELLKKVGLVKKGT